MYTKTETGCPAKQVRAPIILARGAVVGSLTDPHAPRLLVPGCRSALQKMLAEGAVFLTFDPRVCFHKSWAIK